ncbi:MAG: hypothetical protein CVU09_01630 [Bacteroidetes bacterium HGW-Bacteroidetes-4]|nr:MAG: hypothetical protein CVU09_01630 [Bacteroidetes bacterium HGW-Bacteroidetes-4]
MQQYILINTIIKNEHTHSSKEMKKSWSKQNKNLMKNIFYNIKKSVYPNHFYLLAINVYSQTVFKYSHS